MVNLRLFYLLLLLFLGLPQVWAEPFALPDLSTDEKRLQWLLMARENIPGLFSDAAKYDIDLLKLLEDQETLQKLLMKNPEYLKTMQEKHPSWLTVTIAPKSEETVKAMRIDPKAVESWKNALKKTFESLPGSGNIEEKLVSSIDGELKKIGSRNFDGLLTGLVMSLPPEERKAVFSASHEEKVKLLESKLPPEIGDGFKGNVYGFSKNPSKTEALEVLSNLRFGEERVKELTELYLVLQNDMGAFGEGSRLEGLTAEDLSFFTDPDAIRPRLEILNKKVPLKKNLLSSIQKHVATFSSQVEEVEEKLGKGIKLQEMPPAMGIFRGCTGGDCSTQFSFPYPNAPEERIFYVYGADGANKGYVTGSLVEADGKKAFRVITIAGPKISSGDAKMILDGLYEIRGKLHAEVIALPSKEKIGGLINFTPIKEVYNEAVKDKASVKITYLDKDSRNIIESFHSDNNSGAYDKMDSNKMGVIYEPATKGGVSVEVNAQRHAFKAIKPEDLKRASLEFSLELYGSNRFEQIPKVLHAANFPESEHAGIISALTNEKKLKVKDYQASIKNLMGISEEELKSKNMLLMNGYLSSPDISTVEGLPEFVKRMEDLIIETPHVFAPKVKSPELMKALIERNNKILNAQLVTYGLKENVESFRKEIRLLIETGEHSVLNALATYFFSNPISENFEEELMMLMKKADTGILLNLPRSVLKHPHTQNMDRAVRLFMEVSDPMAQEQLIEHALAAPHALKWRDITKSLLEKQHRMLTDAIARHVFAQPYSAQMRDLMEYTIKTGSMKTLKNLDMYAFSQDHWKRPEDGALRGAIYIQDSFKRKAHLDQGRIPTGAPDCSGMYRMLPRRR